MRVGAGVGDNRTLGERRTDSALHLAALGGEGGGQADKALAAVGQVGAQNEVELSACAADVLDACGFRIDLTVQVDVDGVVDRDKVVDLCDDARVVRVADRCAHDSRIVVDVVIQLLRAGAECKYLTTLVDGLLGAGQLACTGDVDEGIDIHLGVYAQIGQVGLCDQGADCVRHTADAQLEAGTVRDLLNDQLCNGVVNLGRSGSTHLTERRVVALDDHVDLGDVNRVLKAAETARHILVDLNDDVLAGLADRLEVGCVRTEAEIAVLVHRCNLNQRVLVRDDVFTVVARQLGIADRCIICHSLCDHFALNAAHVPGVPGEMLRCVVYFCDFRNPHQDAAADFDVGQLVCACSERFIQCDRRTGAPAVVDPVAALDALDRVLGGGQFALI